MDSVPPCGIAPPDALGAPLSVPPEAAGALPAAVSDGVACAWQAARMNTTAMPRTLLPPETLVLRTSASFPGRPAADRASTPMTRVEGVGKGVPEQVEREDREHDRETWQRDHPGIGPVVADV